MTQPRIILPAGTTETALIDGISAAGAAPELMAHTPSADVEILEFGAPARSPVTPVSPNGCPTPAAVTRAVREVCGFDVTVVDAGLAKPTSVPTVDLGIEPGNDVRETAAVPDAAAIFDRAHGYGASLPDGEDDIVIGETVPGGTTTALGVLTALGEPTSVSSSLPENPVERKRRVVDEALAASDLAAGDCESAPFDAIRAVGDPVQPTVAGIAAGVLESSPAASVTLAGGTQMVAVAAILRHAGVDAPLEIATTSFVAAEQGDQLESACAALDCELTVTDPGFADHEREHVAMDRYCAGEAKEGVAMGGALSLVPEGELSAVRDRFETVCRRLGIESDGLAERSGSDTATDTDPNTDTPSSGEPE
ncbi:nicotinate mononucleotide-dependent phosphoribosyltransferase CobT [Natrialba sp. SSL1]|uniref:nicotinate mononucleotide-dependent phosphoribosyltransferase CobT n=1 Tax=Natrialba sp. SSL1 TaxID=1869245 RepID=UPI0008F905B0|nr:TIGR00303 family protein [Natrialba sp. SSL1]OIB55950.1 TIGR00303 family protein [Natrialba sp. SSL1]